MSIRICILIEIVMKRTSFVLWWIRCIWLMTLYCKAVCDVKFRPIEGNGKKNYSPPGPRVLTLFKQYYSVICRPSYRTVGRPRAEIRTQDRRSRGRETNP